MRRGKKREKRLQDPLHFPERGKELLSEKREERKEYPVQPDIEKGGKPTRKEGKKENSHISFFLRREKRKEKGKKDEMRVPEHLRREKGSKGGGESDFLDLESSNRKSPRRGRGSDLIMSSKREGVDVF